MTDSASKSLTWQHILLFYTPSGLATTFQFCEQLWWSSSLQSNGIYGLTSIPSPNAYDPVGHSVRWWCPCPLHITWNLHPSSVDALVDVYGRSCSFPFIHPKEVFLAWHWVIARPLSSCGIVLLSLSSGSRLDWGGTGTSVLYLADTHTVREHQPLM